jgi:hypothetical protein
MTAVITMLYMSVVPSIAHARISWLTIIATRGLGGKGKIGELRRLWQEYWENGDAPDVIPNGEDNAAKRVGASIPCQGWARVARR